VYKDFKEALSICFNPNTPPAPQLDRMVAAFQCLSLVNAGTAPNVTNLAIPTQLQALIALAALPHKWEHLVHILIHSEDLDDLDFGIVHDAVINQYDTEMNRGGHKGGHNANKISAIKRKRSDPCFNQQGSSQQCNDDSGSQRNNQCSQRGKGKGKGKDKGKGRANNPGHVHIASVAAIPAPVSHSVAHIGPSSVTKQTITKDPPKE